MRKSFMFGGIAVMCLCFGLAACAKEEAGPGAAAPGGPEEANPFFSAWSTPFATPPFDAIKEAHFRPAFEAGMAEQKKEIEAIVRNSEPPSFANTIEAAERSGALL
ncbi:MAG: dipeptidyl carboxypeptidase II, partial [Candidatus Aminicenantales bacterium]